MKLGIVSDIHEDFVSLKEALIICEKNNCDEIVCLGDIAGYDYNFYKHLKTRDLGECLTVLQQNCKYVVIGNHDLYAIRKLPTANSYFSFPSNWYDLDIEERKKHSKKRVWLYETDLPTDALNQNHISYLESLPESIIIECCDLKILFSHFIYPDFTGSSMFRFHNPWEINLHIKFMQANNINIGFSGHMHPNGLMIGESNQIKHTSFGKRQLITNEIQYFGPSIANNINKSGVVLVDFDEKSIETLKLTKSVNKVYMVYGKLFKKN